MFRRNNTSLRDLQPERIAIIKPSALGDIVHALPVLAALRRRFFNAHISWIVNRAYEPLLHGHPDLNETVPFERGAVKKSYFKAAWSFTKLLADLRRRRFDLVLDLQGLLRTGIMAFSTRARRRVGLGGAREGARWFYSDIVPLPDFHHTHAVDRYWKVVEALGAGDGDKLFRVPLVDAAVTAAHGMLRDGPRPWLMVGVGSRWLTKRWPPHHFGRLVQRTQERFGGTAVFVGGGDETSLALEAAKVLHGPVRHLTGQTTLPQLAALLSLADIMIANDTGPLHLAAALGRPVVAPYTCTNVCRTGPYGQLPRGVETTVWCQGSYLRTCPRLECMAELTPDRLWPHVAEILQAWQRHSQSA
jgi:lipopolysaccharide heptosyltransferase I